MFHVEQKHTKIWCFTMNDNSAHVIQVQISEILPNPKQPRKVFRKQDLEDLSRSVAKEGVLQPLLVTRQQNSEKTSGYTLLMGERRLRAARAAGLRTVPCVVKDASTEDYLRPPLKTWRPAECCRRGSACELPRL